MKSLFKVTAIMSSATVIILFFNLLKSKAFAIILGPSGVGLYSILISLYTTIISLTSITSGGSIVKKIAEANSNDDKSKLYYIKNVFSIINLSIGFLLAIIIFIFSDMLSQYAFNSLVYSLEIKLLGFIIIVAMFAEFWQSWLNGLREVKIIAKIRVFSTIISGFLAIGYVYIYKIDGVIYSILSVPIVTFFIAGYFFVRVTKIPPFSFSLSFKKYSHEITDIFKVGLALLLIAMLFHIGVYVNRSIISSELGIASVGIFFAAWTISMSYLDVFLSSLSVDYYPRLSENKDDIEHSMKIVNEQLFFSLLISFPIVIFVYIYAPNLIEILYSKDFIDGASILRWQIIGDIFKVFVWIFGFVFIAQNNLKYSLLIQIIWVFTYTVILFFGLPFFGLVLTGISFLATYFLTFLVSLFYVKFRYNFKFSRDNIKIFYMMLFSLGMVIFPFENIIYFLFQNFILFLVVLYSFINLKGNYVKNI